MLRSLSRRSSPFPAQVRVRLQSPTPLACDMRIPDGDPFKLKGGPIDAALAGRLERWLGARGPPPWVMLPEGAGAGAVESSHYGPYAPLGVAGDRGGGGRGALGRSVGSGAAEARGAAGAGFDAGAAGAYAPSAVAKGASSVAPGRRGFTSPQPYTQTLATNPEP